MSRMHSFCGTCWYFGQALTDSLVAAGEPPPTLGLVCIAAVGSQIENWMPDRRVASDLIACPLSQPSYAPPTPLLRPSIAPTTLPAAQVHVD